MVLGNIGGGRMIIGVDAGCLGINDKNLQVGVYQVAKNILEQLGKKDTKNHYYLYSFLPIEKKILQGFGPHMENIVVHPIKGWMKIWLPLRLQYDNPDIFLGLSQALPHTFKGIKTIAFVYDIAFAKYPELYPDSYIKLRNQTQHLAKKANKIITISQTTKDDIINAYKFDAQSITVCYPGVRKFNVVSEKYDSGKPYFLFVGALKGIKNVPTIIKAFSRFLKQSKKEYSLYLTGGSKWYDSEIDTALHSIPGAHKERIQFLGFVDDITLAKLYKGATAFVSPSIYEGFGMTFVEAMAAGCPIIGSTAGAVPEIVGEAGILLDPMDITGISHAMERMTAFTSLRLKLQEAGKKQAKKFTWENFAAGVFDVINAV